MNPAHDFDGAPCLTDPPLWESTNPADSDVAARMCKTECPHVAACLERLKWAQEVNTGGPYTAPSGTWAGLLVGAKKKPGRPRKKAA